MTKYSYTKLLIEMLKVDSSTGNTKGINDVGKIISKRLATIGLKRKIYKKKNKPILFTFSTKNFDSSKPVLLISGHTDTVISSKHIPVKSRDGWVYGSGANDMKGGLVAMIYGLEAYYQQYGTINNLIITLTPDEETGSRTYSEVLAKIYKKADYSIVLEGKGNSGEICRSRRGIGLLTMEFRGKAGHSGYYANKYPNAIDEAVFMINKIVNLANLKQNLTINSGKIIGGTATNVVAEKCNVEMDIRFDNDQQFEAVKTKIINIVTNKKNDKSMVKYKLNKIFSPMTENKKSAELLKIVQNIYKKLGLRLETHSRSSASDANHISSLGVGVLDGFGTYGKDIHTIKERVSISSVFDSGQIICEMLYTLSSKNR